MDGNRLIMMHEGQIVVAVEEEEKKSAPSSSPADG